MSSVQLTAADFHAARRFAETSFGRIAYVERGEGPAALFFHGFSLNGYQWRGALGLLPTQRRCIALDFMGMGTQKRTRNRIFLLKRRQIWSLLFLMSLQSIRLTSSPTTAAAQSRSFLSSSIRSASEPFC